VRIALREHLFLHSCFINLKGAWGWVNGAGGGVRTLPILEKLSRHSLRFPLFIDDFILTKLSPRADNMPI